MTEDIAVRKYGEGDEEGIVNLLQHVFKGWPSLDISCTSLDYYKWKHLSDGNRSFITVAEHEDRIIGCHHARGTHIKVNDSVLPCTTTCDFAVHPDYRKRGISQRMGLGFSRPWRTKIGMVFDYFIVGNPILVKSFSKTRPKFPTKIINMTHITDIDLHLQKNTGKNNTILRTGYKILSGINRIKNRQTKSSRTPKINIYEADIFPETINKFWDRVFPEYDFIIKRDTATLNHNYCDPRNRASKIYIAGNEEEIQGFVVLRVNNYNPDYPVGYIVDLLAKPGHVDIVARLIEKSMQYFEENKVNIVNYQIPKKHEYTEILSQYGFIDSQVTLYVFYVPSNEENILHTQLKDNSKIYLSWGDHDVLPAFIPNYDT